MSMKKFIEPKSDQLNADDLIGGNLIIKITKVRVTDEAQQACTIWYEGNEKKPWKPCKTMGRVLVAAWGENPQNYVGKQVELMRDAEVIFGGVKLGGIRIRALSDISADFDIALTISRGVKKPARIHKLKATSAAPLTSTEPTPALVPLPADLQSAGEAEAGKGVAAYTAWIGTLNADQKEKLKASGMNSVWSKAAKLKDKSEEIPL